MKRQKGEDFAAARKKGKREAEKNNIIMKPPGEEEEQKKTESRVIGSGQGLTHWEECRNNWPWLGGGLDEQMSWSSLWLPVWDMDLMGDAFGYNDVVWDDDIWNLRTQIPIPSSSQI